VKTNENSKTKNPTSAGVVADDSREGGARLESRSNTATPHPSRTTSRPQRETKIPSKSSEKASRAVGAVVSPNREDQAKLRANPILHSPVFPDLGGYRELRLLAELFWDRQKGRCADENRFRHAPVNKDLTQILLDAGRHSEVLAEKAMLQCFRRVAPEIAGWAEDMRGVGPHTVARLLGLIGHPAIAEPYHWQVGKAPQGHVCNGHCGKSKDGKKKHLVADPPYLRSVAQLRSYCGVGDPVRRRRKQMDQADALRCGSVRGRTLVYLLAVAQEKSPLKKPGAYRLLYDESKADFAERHPDATKKHCQNHALRIVGKEILKDIWVVARKSLRLPTIAETIKEKRA